MTVVSLTPISQPESADLFGVPISCLSGEDTVSFIESLIRDGNGHQVCTADASGVVLAQDDKELMDLYKRASLVTCDSSGVAWALERQKRHLPRVRGVDLVDRFCIASAKSGYRLYFLGGLEGVAKAAADRMESKHPGCEIVGWHHGFFPDCELELVVESMKNLGVDIVFVGMGIPRQEKIVARLLEKKVAKVGMGVGGTFDVLSGRVRRAPGIFQSLRLEWLWRVLVDPRKFKKVGLLPRFVRLVLTVPRKP